jgi:hypothetical protein
MIFTKKYIANPLILQYVILSMRNSYLSHPITHKSAVPRVNCPADGVVPDFLHALPNRFGTGVAVALTRQKTTEAGYQSRCVSCPF